MRSVELWAHEVRIERLDRLAALYERNHSADRVADDERQERETDREQTRLITERKIQKSTSSRRTSKAERQHGDGKKEKDGGTGKSDASLANAFKKMQQKDQDRAKIPEMSGPIKAARAISHTLLVRY